MNKLICMCFVSGLKGLLFIISDYCMIRKTFINRKKDFDTLIKRLKNSLLLEVFFFLK